MKTSKVCPKCDGRKFFQIPKWTQTYCDAGGVLRSVEVLSAEVRTGEKGILGGDKTEMVSTEAFESVVCAGCGYTELYVTPASLLRLATIAEKSRAVEVVTNEAPAQPFR